MSEKNLQNPFNKEDWLSEIVIADKNIKSLSTETFNNFTQTHKSHFYMSKYTRFIQFITKHAFVTALATFLIIGTIGVSAAELIAPENYKPSKTLGIKAKESPKSNTAITATETSSSLSSKEEITNVSLKIVTITREKRRLCLDQIPLFTYANPNNIVAVSEYLGKDYPVIYYRYENSLSIIPGKYKFNAYNISSGGVQSEQTTCDFLTKNNTKAEFSKDVEIKKDTAPMIYYNASEQVADNFAFLDQTNLSIIPEPPKFSQNPITNIQPTIISDDNGRKVELLIPKNEPQEVTFYSEFCKPSGEKLSAGLKGTLLTKVANTQCPEIPNPQNYEYWNKIQWDNGKIGFIQERYTSFIFYTNSTNTKQQKELFTDSVKQYPTCNTYQLQKDLDLECKFDLKETSGFDYFIKDGQKWFLASSGNNIYSYQTTVKLDETNNSCLISDNQMVCKTRVLSVNKTIDKAMLDLRYSSVKIDGVYPNIANFTTKAD